MDAILFSANPSIVDVDDAREHLDDHKELFWSVGFRIVKDKLSFPIFGFIHVRGGQVEYRARIADIIPFSPNHYENPEVKPESFREGWKRNHEPWKNELVMTEIVPFSFDTYSFRKCPGGELVKQPPEAFVRVFPPNESSGPSPAVPSKNPIDEKNLENFVVQRLEEVEKGLRLVDRQLSTPAGRLDLLCKDTLGNYVVVELKKSQGLDQVVGQILRYMGWAKQEYPKSIVRGIVIVGKKDEALRYTLKAVPNIEAKEFKLTFTDAFETENQNG